MFDIRKFIQILIKTIPKFVDLYAELEPDIQDVHKETEDLLVESIDLYEKAKFGVEMILADNDMPQYRDARKNELVEALVKAYIAE